MADLGVVELNELVDRQKIGASAIIVLAIGLLALIADGFDLAAIGFVAPELVKDWSLQRGAMVPVFQAGIVGLLFGAPLLGVYGDRFGRKSAILIGLGIVGAVTLATMAAGSVNQMIVLRFLTGLGLGGVIPNVIALVAERAPRRRRGMFIAVINFGVPAGIALPGWVAASLVPEHGWRAILFVGGVLPLLIAGIGLVALPESIRFLAQFPGRLDAVRRMARALRPDLAIGAATRFVDATPAAVARSPLSLFGSGMGAITPLLWVALAANQMANFFSLTWLPTLLQNAGASTSQAGVNASLFSIGGIAGGVCLTFVLDRLGVIPLLLLFFAGAPLVAAIGLPGLTPWEHGLIIAGAGFCVTGNNFAFSCILGMIYPTPIRSMGVGWAQAAGRIGALAAPTVGGALLAMAFSMQELLLAPAYTMGLGAVASVAIAVLCMRRFGSMRIGETAAAHRTASALDEADAALPP